MARSIKKGFFVDYHLLEKIEKAVNKKLKGVLNGKDGEALKNLLKF